MNRFLLTAAGISLVFMVALAHAEPQANAPADMKLTDEQCVTLWKQAASATTEDTESIPASAAQTYVKDMSKLDTDKDGKVSTKEWADGCKTGLIMSAPATPNEKLAPTAP